MAKIFGAIVVDSERCKGCELCAVACPQRVITMSPIVNHKGYNFAVQQDDLMRCNGCSSCAVVCPDGCITVYRAKVDMAQAAPHMATLHHETALAV